MRGCASWIVAFAAFFGLSILAGQLLGPVTCRDGWHSPSLGHRGACSWHGGVDHSRDALIIIFAAAGAFAGFVFHESRVGRWAGGETWSDAREPYLPAKYEPPRPHVPPGPGEPDCPKCGSAMRLRLAKRGRRRGTQFWGCSRFPDCNGTRPSKDGHARARHLLLPFDPPSDMQ
jgi:hypothetical protein